MGAVSILSGFREEETEFGLVEKDKQSGRDREGRQLLSKSIIWFVILTFRVLSGSGVFKELILEIAWFQQYWWTMMPAFSNKFEAPNTKLGINGK